MQLKDGPNNEGDLIEAFQAFDKAGNGFIMVDDMKHVLTSMGTDRLTEEEADMMLKIADSITKQGGIALFNTAEESLFQTSMTAKRLRLKNGFLTGNTDDVTQLLEKSKAIIEANPGKQFCLIVDSLQCLDDGAYSSGKITSGTAIRCLQHITDFCKETGAIGIIINQVNKSGKMAGSNKLKHMVDSMMHLSVEEKDEDFKGCRILETKKNRFGGCGHMFYLALRKTGFREVAKIEEF